VIHTCPACDSDALDVFHVVASVPTNSCLLLEDQQEAADFPRGMLELAFCSGCGFITNRAFDASRAEYSGRYEETQSYSPRFVDFGRDLARTWVDRHELRGRHVLEVGCGKGEFLVWMLEAGIRGGVGIDPGVHPERHDGETAGQLEWIADFYDERYARLEADALVCRHTLEHIHPVGSFLRMLRDNLRGRDPVLLFELPDATRVLEEVAFWDTYYEHCSYFSPGSLARLFRRAGFEILAVERTFNDQYLLLEARVADPLTATPDTAFAIEEDLDRLRSGVERFAAGYRATVDRWERELAAVRSGGGQAVLWGGGSKAVAFLTALSSSDLVAGAVDINPHKQGRFIAGTGHPVLSPEDVVSVDPELIVVMNPIYQDEIRRELQRLGCGNVQLLTV
jgi:SAM-dependent methyltransferase